MPIRFVFEDELGSSTEDLFGCSDAELDAIVSRVRVKLAIVATRYGTDEDGLAEMMALMPIDEHDALVNEINAASVDAHTGSGLH